MDTGYWWVGGWLGVGLFAAASVTATVWVWEFVVWGVLSVSCVRAVCRLPFSAPSCVKNAYQISVSR